MRTWFGRDVGVDPMAGRAGTGGGLDVGMVEPPSETDGVVVTHITRGCRRDVIVCFGGDPGGDTMARGAGTGLYASMVEDAACR